MYQQICNSVDQRQGEPLVRDIYNSVVVFTILQVLGVLHLQHAKRQPPYERPDTWTSLYVSTQKTFEVYQIYGIENLAIRLSNISRLADLE